VKKNQYSIPADKLKGVLITRTAIKTLVPEDIVEKVITFQFKDATKAMKQHEQIEISGFGKFMTSPRKIEKKIAKLEETLMGMNTKLKERAHEIPERRLAIWDKLTESIEKELSFLKTKKGGYESKHKRNTGGDMELHIREEGDRGDSQPKDGDM
jgi:nucleoid DNA-binding protein